MKVVQDLSKEEMLELKQNYLDNHLLEVEDRTASYGELADADEIVSDNIIFDTYEGTVFTDDDFFCNQVERNI